MLLQQIEQGTRYYFLLKWSGLSLTEITNQLSCEIRNLFPTKSLEKLRESFFQSFKISSHIVKLHYTSLESKKQLFLQIFLGEEPYHINATEKEIIEESLAWRQEENEKFSMYQEKYSFFEKFQTNKEIILLIFNCFKYEEPVFYEMLKKYHNDDLNQWNIPSAEYSEIYQLAIKKINEILKLLKKGSIRIDEENFIFLKINSKNLFSRFPEILEMENEKQEEYQKKIKEILFARKK